MKGMPAPKKPRISHGSDEESEFESESDDDDSETPELESDNDESEVDEEEDMNLAAATNEFKLINEKYLPRMSKSWTISLEKLSADTTGERKRKCKQY